MNLHDGRKKRQCPVCMAVWLAEQRFLLLSMLAHSMMHSVQNTLVLCTAANNLASHHKHTISSFTSAAGPLPQVEVTKQLLSEQLKAKSSEATLLQEQLSALQAELGAAKLGYGDLPSPMGSSTCVTPRTASGSLDVMAAAEAKQAAMHKKSSFAARLKLPWGHKHAAASPQPSPAGEPSPMVPGSPSTTSTNLAPVEVAAIAAGPSLQALLDNDSCSSADIMATAAEAVQAAGTSDSHAAAAFHGPGVTSAAAGFPVVSAFAGEPAGGAAGLQADLPADPTRHTAGGARLSGSDDGLATTSRANPGVLELVQHYEVVAGMERSSSVTSTTSVSSTLSELSRSAQENPKAKHSVAAEGASTAVSASSWLRPTPLPRVATLTRTSSTASSPKSPAPVSKIPAALAKPASAQTASPGGRSAFGRSAPAPIQTGSSTSPTSRIPFSSGYASSPKSPSLSATTSGASTPTNRLTAGGSSSGPDMAVFSRQLQAAAASSTSPTKAGAAPAVQSSRIPGPSNPLSRSGSSSSGRGEGTVAGEASLKRQLSRLVPGSSNGSVGSERSSGGGSMQGSIFKSSTAAAKHKGAGSTAAGRTAGSGSHPASKAK